MLLFIAFSVWQVIFDFFSRSIADSEPTELEFVVGFLIFEKLDSLRV